MLKKQHKLQSKNKLQHANRKVLGCKPFKGLYFFA